VVEEVKREVVIRRVVAGKLSVTEAAPLLGLSERQVWRLKGRYVEEGTAALAHGNRGRVPANKIAGALREKIIRLARSRYAGVNDSHLAELLREREHLEISRRSLQRVLRGAGLASPRRHRPPRYRRRREREPSAGAMVLVDGSRHRWFGDDRPYTSCIAAIDDATSQVVAACFREQEDAAGYFTVLGQMLQTTGIPLALYSDRHGVFWRSAHERPAHDEELAGERLPTQFGRALGELSIQPIFANSPQAKGRIERLWGTWQDRLFQELRLAGVGDIAAANRFLAQYLPRHNARFAVSAATDEPSWRALSEGTCVDDVCCFKYVRVVAPDNTVRLGGTVVQLPPRSAHWSWAAQRVEARQHLDGSWSVHTAAGSELVRTAAPSGTPKLFAQGYVRSPIAGVPPLPWRPGPDHPWKNDRRTRVTAAQRRLIIARQA
jgi:transposase